MPGTVVRDSLAPNLLAGVTTTTAGGAANGPVWEASWPGEVQYNLTVASATGTTPTITLTIQGCETADFTTADVVSLGDIVAVDPADASVFGLTTHTDARYVRAVSVVTGTTGVFVGAVLTPVLPNDRRTRGVRPTSRILA